MSVESSSLSILQDHRRAYRGDFNPSQQDGDAGRRSPTAGVIHRSATCRRYTGQLVTFLIPKYALLPPGPVFIPTDFAPFGVA